MSKSLVPIEEIVHMVTFKKAKETAPCDQCLNKIKSLLHWCHKPKRYRLCEEQYKFTAITLGLYNRRQMFLLSKLILL